MVLMDIKFIIGRYYITDKKDNGVWLCEDKDRSIVEEYAKTLE